MILHLHHLIAIIISGRVKCADGQSLKGFRMSVEVLYISRPSVYVHKTISEANMSVDKSREYIWILCSTDK